MNEARSMLRKAARKAGLSALSIGVFVLGMNLLWFFVTGMSDVTGLWKRVFFSVIVVPPLVFVVALMYAVGDQRK